MSKSNNHSLTSKVAGFCDLLTVLFIGLKLGHVINWSWWWVLCPLWIGTAFILVLVLVDAIIVSAHNTTEKAETFEPHAGKTLGL